MKEKNPSKLEHYRIVRYFTPSSITASQTTEGQGGSVRKKFMSQTFTYRILLDDLTRQVQLENRNPQTAANRATVLRGFLRANRLNIDDVVGNEMRVGHLEALERFLNSLKEEGKSNVFLKSCVRAMVHLARSAAHQPSFQSCPHIFFSRHQKKKEYLSLPENSRNH